MTVTPPQRASPCDDTMDSVTDDGSSSDSSREANAEYEIDLSHVEDIVQVMRMQESSHYQRQDYMAQNTLFHVVDAAWRQRIVEWMYGVVDHCSLKRDCVAHAAYYLDLCTERGLVDSRQQYQLAAMCALLISIKMVDSTVVKLQSMVVLGRGIFTEDDVIEMERKMLCALNWKVHPPTPVCFLRQFLRLLPPCVSPMTRYVIAEVTRFIAEISICLYKFIKFPPSVIAYSGMLIAIERIDATSLTASQRHDVFTVMSHHAGLDHSSAQVMDAVHHLRLSIEKNVSLNELMETIDAQCNRANCKLLPYNHGFDGYMNSPREVIPQRH